VDLKPLLCGEGVKRSELEELAARRGFEAVGDVSKADAVVVFKPTRSQIDRLLATQPPYALIEIPAPDRAFGKRMMRALASKGLFVSLCTASAFHADLTKLICTALGVRISLSEERRFNIETAVEEALSNAMVHGNLDVASSLRNDPADFDMYCDLVNQRLTTPLYAERRIEILATWSPEGLDIEVHDEGRGYEASNVNAPPQLEAKCGRGFILIRELTRNVTISEHGRSLTMSFAP